MFAKIAARLPFTFLALAGVLMYEALFDPAVRNGAAWRSPLLIAVSVLFFVCAGYGMAQRHRRRDP